MNKTKEQQGWETLAQLLTKVTNELVAEDEKKRSKQIKKANRMVEQQDYSTRTQSWYKEATTEVNGQPTRATIKEAWIQEDGCERSVTEIQVGKTTKRRYDINRWTLDDRIAETAEEEEDRINGEA